MQLTNLVETSGVVALKAHYHHAVTALQGQLPNHPKLSIHLLGSFYPAGDEQVIVYEVTGRIVPEGGIPIHVGAVVSNVESALNIANALEGHPVTHKYVTVTGAVAEPKTVHVPLGISVEEALALAGGAAVSEYRIINGEPMMGRLVSADTAVTKTTKGLIVLPADHPLVRSLEQSVAVSIRNAATACMQCSLCSNVCPRGLLGHRIQPHKLMRMAAYGSLCDPVQTPVNAYLCCGCRLCEYACVMGLQPWKFNGNLKGILGKQGHRNTLHAQPEQADPFRSYKKYPLDKLIAQLGLTRYHVDAPMTETGAVFTKVTLPLQQNVGAPAQTIVQVGERVEQGSLIGKIPEGKLGTNLHASIAGIVTAVTADSITIQS